jgi:hypothetical protein
MMLFSVISKVLLLGIEIQLDDLVQASGITDSFSIGLDLRTCPN